MISQLSGMIKNTNILSMATVSTIFFTPLNITNDDNEISAQEVHQCNGENQKLDEDCQNVEYKNDGVNKTTKRDGKINHRESNEMQRLQLENMTMKASLQEFEEQQHECFEYYEKLLDERNEKRLK